MGTTAEKLTYLNETKQAIKDKITSYGVTVADNTPFRNYADMVEEAVSTKSAGFIDGVTPFELNERDFSQITPTSYSTYVVRKYAFYRHGSLTRAVIPAFVNSVETYGFGTCTALTEVVFKGATNIQAGAFSQCSALQKFYLPDVADIERIPTLANTNAFTGTTCQFVVPNEASRVMYVADSNWNTYSDRFVVEEASV